LEHPAVTSLLPLARISKFFVVNYMPNTPVGSLDVKNQQVNKVKGQLGFPQKTKPPSGATTIFRKKFASMLSMTRPKPRADSGGAQEAKREGREPEIAYASTRIHPFSLTSGPAGYS
jgi:hypothetical protein